MHRIASDSLGLFSSYLAQRIGFELSNISLNRCNTDSFFEKSLTTLFKQLKIELNKGRFMAHSAQNLNMQSRLDPASPTFRSGAVARLAGMPVSTLRIWEQRYQAVGPITAPSGHRLYSAADVERVMLLRQLTQQGHAIGSLAMLNVEQLQHLAATRVRAETAASAQPMVRSAPLRIVVVGQAMAQRLRRPAVLARWTRPLQIVGAFDSLDETVHAAAGQGGAPVDLLLWHASDLQADAVTDLKAAQTAWQAREMAVAYRFAGAAARDALVNAGAAVVREPSDDGALVAWLSSFGSAPVLAGTAHSRAQTSGAIAHGIDQRLFDALTLSAGGNALPMRRFDDTALTKFAGLSSSVACECPSHVAELLMQIASFERYSASCANRNLADAQLHSDLQRVAGTARLLFEAALERVAVAEGLALP
jgi:DNA-binding transcriptional MerR regulator